MLSADDMAREAPTASHQSERHVESQAHLAVAVHSECLLEVSRVATYIFEFSERSVVPVEVSESIKDILGYSAAEVCTEGWYPDHVHHEDLPQVLSSFERILSDKNYIHQYRIRHRSGNYCWVRDEMILRQDKLGRPIGVTGNWINITDERAAKEEMYEYKRQFQDSFELTIRVISTVLELRDPYTAKHDRRVGRIASDIACQMGWSHEKCCQLQLVGMVHDIGKIAIPSELLSKPTVLSALEYELVKTHVEKGYEILKDIKFEMPIGEIVYQHHERLDGSGYPRGLRGDEILMEARILTVADVFESMASHRPYRPSLGVDAAITEIEQGKGIKYDENVVNTLLKMIRETGYILSYAYDQHKHRDTLKLNRM